MGEGEGHDKNRSMKLIVAGILAIVVAVGVAGYLIGSSSSNQLESDLADMTQQRDDESARAADLAKQLDGLDSDVQDLEGKLAKAQKSGAAKPTVAPIPGGLAEIGKPHSVGQMTITPTSFSEISSDGQTTTYQAVISVKNDGSEGINPFCGEEGGLVDSTGRTFDPDTDIDYEASNCGDDVQPGLAQTDYRLTFTLPSDASPTILKLWGDYGYENSPQLWNVKGL